MEITELNTGSSQKKKGRVGGKKCCCEWTEALRKESERTVYSIKRCPCACDTMNGTFVESRKYIKLGYRGLCQRRRIHCNRTTRYCSLFFLELWTSIDLQLLRTKAYSNVEHCVTREQKRNCCCRSPCVLS